MKRVHATYAPSFYPSLYFVLRCLVGKKMLIANKSRSSWREKVNINQPQQISLKFR